MINNNSQGPGQGAVNILLRIGTILVNIVESRIRLLAVELEEEKNHILSLLLMSGLTLICLTFGLLSLFILICWAIDPIYRFTALATFTGIMLLIALIFALMTLKKAKSSTFLEETRDNLKVDKELLMGEKSE